MAIKLVRKKRKNADGSYDIVHYETQAKVVWFEDGESFQEKYDNGELTGPAGADGKNGSDGSPGRDGSNGVTFTPSVNDSGDLSWTNSGGLSNPTTRNIRGPAGANGNNATINGVNALTIAAGNGLSGSQSGSTYTISLSSHTQPANDITAGTFAGQVVAASSAQTPDTSLLRNSRVVAADTTPSNNGEIFWTYG